MKRLGVLLFFALFLVFCNNNVPEKVDFNILFTTDVRGEVKGCGCRVGGGNLLQRAEQLEITKKMYPNHILVDGGHFIYGNGTLPRLKWQNYIKLYDMLGYDIVNVTPFDFKDGLEEFKNEIKKYDIDFISASLIDSKTKKYIFKPYVIKEININGLKFKVGFIGLFEDLWFGAFPINRQNNVTVRNIEDVIKTDVKNLRDKVDILVALSYSKWELNINYAKKYPYFDIIISGNGITNKKYKVGQTLLTRAHNIAKFIGNIKLEVSKNKDIVKDDVEFISVDKDGPISDKMNEFLKKEENINLKH